MSEPTTDYRIVKAKPRSKKLKPRVDLAAMVSISFLLIMFFMVNQAMSRPQAMDLGVPERGCDGPCYGIISCGVWSTRTVTLLLDDNNRIIYYRGLLEIPDVAPKEIGYGNKGIREELLTAKQSILKNTGDPNKGVVVIIKPSKKCNYKNLVDILDEMAINQIPTYAIVNDFTPEEYKLLHSK